MHRHLCPAYTNINMQTIPNSQELRSLSLNCLQLRHPIEKSEQVIALAATYAENAFINSHAAIPEPDDLPGRLSKPHLVEPKNLPKRSIHTQQGHAALIHAVAHIELNAINLALDAIWRFAHMPRQYYLDWLRVAGEEAQHFRLLNQHLNTMGYVYGDFDAHDGLWQMTHQTRHDPIARMALVPRLLEARGLDATPPMQARLRNIGDEAGVAILDIILRDEIGHVAIGNRWYRWLCEQAGLDAHQHFKVLAQQYNAPKLRPPFNYPARTQAGFTADELHALELGG